MTGMTRRLLILILPLAFAQCVATLPEEGVPPPGTYGRKLDMRVMGARRSYLLHVPGDLDPGKRVPLLLVIHGAFSTPSEAEERSGFSALADREKILVSYPTGAYGLFGFFRHWNAGHCCGKAARDGTDDVGFLMAVVEDVCARFPVDRDRIYMVGFSNGGMLTYRFAAERTDVLAAAAPIAASLGGRATSDVPLWTTPAPKGPLPLIVFHARDDPVVPFNGGVSPQKGGEREFLSVAESVAFWVGNNRCGPDAEVASLRDGRITRTTWSDPQGESPVLLHVVEGWGHRWPTRPHTDALDEGDPLRGFDAAEIIWKFFAGKRRRAPRSTGH